MVIKLAEKPKDQLKDLNDDCVYFEFTYKDEPYAYFGFRLFSDTAIVHNDVTKWNHNIAKQAQTDFKYTLDFLKRLGIEKIIALWKTEHPKADAKWIKFIRMFGFSEPEYLLKAVKEI